MYTIIFPLNINVWLIFVPKGLWSCEWSRFLLRTCPSKNEVTRKNKQTKRLWWGGLQPLLYFLEESNAFLKSVPILHTTLLLSWNYNYVYISGFNVGLFQSIFLHYYFSFPSSKSSVSGQTCYIFILVKKITLARSYDR